MSIRELLESAAHHASDFVDSLPKRPVRPAASLEELQATLDLPLDDEPLDPQTVIAELAKAAEPGLIGTDSPRFFGFVIGGSTPASLAAEFLASAWDQNAGLYVAGPSASVAEDVAGRWLTELLGLPQGASSGFVTGGQMANYTGLSAARHHVLEQAGWDVQVDGLQGAPRVRVIVGEQRHSTIDRALRFLGLGTGNLVLVPADEQGRMVADGLRAVIDDYDGPTIVCAQAGNVNSGSFDPFSDVVEISQGAGAWVHVDGAFGLWAAVSDRLKHLVEGVDGADSWATDGHKWLNVPYDSGYVFCAHPDSHRAAMGVRASYLIHSETGAERDPMDWVPEFSRRARGFSTYAGIRALGRKGIVAMIEGCCERARQFAELLGKLDEVEVLNDVVLNQVLVRFGDDDEVTRRVTSGVQEEGTCWMSGSLWQDKAVMRISVSNWATSAEDVERSVEAIAKVASA